MALAAHQGRPGRRFGTGWNDPVFAAAIAIAIALPMACVLMGACISVPAIVGYTVFSYRVFRGKTGELRYD